MEGRYDISWKETLTFKLLHGQWETQGGTEGVRDSPAKRESPTQRER